MSEKRYVLTETELKMYASNPDAYTINEDFQELSGDTSDGYHTFNELYEHRNSLFLALFGIIDLLVYGATTEQCFWSRKHYDGSIFEGYIVVGVKTLGGWISYHMEDGYIDSLPKQLELEHAPEWDRHTSEDVLYRLKNFHYPAVFK